MGVVFGVRLTFRRQRTYNKAPCRKNHMTKKVSLRRTCCELQPRGTSGTSLGPKGRTVGTRIVDFKVTMVDIKLTRETEVKSRGREMIQATKRGR